MKTNPQAGLNSCEIRNYGKITKNGKIPKLYQNKILSKRSKLQKIWLNSSFLTYGKNKTKYYHK